jgi:hypothetical protein
MAEHRLEVLPGVLLAGDVLPILATVGEIELPEIVEAIGGRRVQLLPNLLRSDAS